MVGNKKVCEKMCNDCPFKKTAIPGWLDDYSVDNILAIQSQELAFICHAQLEKDMSWQDAQKSVEIGGKAVCRGFVESIIKSFQMPKTKFMQDCVNQVKGNVSDESMSKWDFVKHHNTFKK